LPVIPRITEKVSTERLVRESEAAIRRIERVVVVVGIREDHHIFRRTFTEQQMIDSLREEGDQPRADN